MLIRAQFVLFKFIYRLKVVMMTGSQVLTYFFLALMLWTTSVKAASQKIYAVQVITIADSTHPSQPTLPKKIPLREKSWFVNYRATVFKINRIVNYIMAIVAVACIVLVFLLIAKIVLSLR